MPGNYYVIGPCEGYSPHIGSLVSMMNYNRAGILHVTKSMTMDQIDYLHDPISNSIGALLMHLAAVERIYYINCFERRDEFNDVEENTWQVALELGEEGRKRIKGKELSYYVDLMITTREETLKALSEKDDTWLLALDPEFSKKNKVNNYWKWFHICEHEAYHRGQIAWLAQRL